MAPRVIAIAVDGSDTAKCAFDFYVEKLHKAGDKVCLIHATEMKTLRSPQSYNADSLYDQDAFQKAMKQERDNHRQKLQGFESLLKNAGIVGKVKSINTESVGPGICKAAQEEGAGLIVVGSRDPGVVRRTLIGSVSEYVAHHTDIPVLVWKKRA